MLPIQYCQHHAKWCPGDLSCQGISRYCIDLIIQNIPSLASKELIFTEISSAQQYCLQQHNDKGRTQTKLWTMWIGGENWPRFNCIIYHGTNCGRARLSTMQIALLCTSSQIKPLTCRGAVNRIFWMALTNYRNSGTAGTDMQSAVNRELLITGRWKFILKLICQENNLTSHFLSFFTNILAN